MDVNHFYNPQINHSEMLHQSFSTSPAGTSHLAPSTPLWGRKQFSWFKLHSLLRFTIILEFILLHNYLKGLRITQDPTIQYDSEVKIGYILQICGLFKPNRICECMLYMLCYMLLCYMFVYMLLCFMLCYMLYVMLCYVEKK